MMTDSLAELPPPKSCTSFVTDEDLQPQEERADTSLLLRHRAPPATAASHYHRLESDRIRTDTAAHVRHAVPVDDQNGDDDDDDEPGSCWWLWLQRRRQLVTKQACKDYWKQIMPCQQCFKYSLTMFRKDVVAGVTVAVMAIPLSMSYARLAGLPAYYGLYATLLPPVMYPVFASSRQLAVGTAALISLLVSSSLPPILQDEGLTDATSPEYIARYAQLAYQCAFLVGLINITMGLLRLGFITQFLSRALVSGFCSGAAVIIAVSQIKYIFGYNVPSSSRLQTLIKGLIDGISQFNWKTFLMGSLSVIILVSIKVASQKHPKLSWIRPVGPFLVSILAIILVVTLDLDTRGIPVVGDIPKGLPSITITLWTPLSNRLWVPVISMVIVGFVQSISIAKRLAYKHGYEIDSSQELIALGMANLVGGAFQSYPVTGALGQSAANDDTGAQTGLASVVTAAVVLIVLLFLTPVFENIPMAVLAATVISFVLGMFDYQEAIYLYKVHKFDFLVWLVTFFGTLFAGVEYGLAIAVGASLVIVIYESAYPHTAVLGRLPGTSLYRNVKQYPNAERYDGLVIVRLDGPLFFANAQNIRDKVRKYKQVATDELSERNCGQVKYIIMDLSPVTHIDTTALHVLDDMYTIQKDLGVQMCYCNPGISVMQRLVKSGIVDKVGRDHIFPAVIDAVHWCLDDMDKSGADLETPHEGDEEVTLNGEPSVEEDPLPKAEK